MDNQELEWKFISRYINGESDAEERARVEHWMEADESNKELVTLLQKAWNSSSQEEQEDWDIDSAWMRYNARYGKDFEESSSKKSKKDHRLNKVSRMDAHRQVENDFAKWGLMAAAAVVCIVLFFGNSMNNNEITSKNELQREIVAEHGERVHFRLSDGTKVILNAGSRISIPETFSGPIRRVQLSGEAFFDVAADPQKPFIVHTESSVTRVLGTRFGIKAYSDNGQVEVVVQEGRVSAYPRKEQLNISKSELVENQIARISRNGKMVVTEVGDMNRYLGWTEGKLVFSEASLSQIETKIERWYDISIEIKPGNKPRAERRLSATFTDQQTLSEVLEAVSLSLEMKYEKKSDGNYVFYG